MNKFVISAFLLVATVTLAKATRPVLTFGALFHEDEDDLAVAFATSIQERNMFFDDIIFNAQIERIGKTDTFKTQKILCNWTSSNSGLAAIVGPSSPKTSSMAQSIAQSLEIPHIQVHWTPSKTKNHIYVEDDITINFYPEQKVLASALANIVENLQWEYYIILYEDNDSLVRIQEILKLANYDTEPVFVRQLSPDLDYRSILKTFKEDLVYHVILDCNVELCYKVLQHAKEIGFLDYVYSYFLTNLESHTMDIAALDTKANITTVRLTDPNSKALRNSVQNWQNELSRNNIDTKLTPEIIRTEQALMQDAISHLTDSISQLHLTEPIESKPLHCFDTERWEGGIRIASFMKVHPKIKGTTGNAMFDARGRRDYFKLEVIEFVRGVPEKIAEWSSEDGGKMTFIRTESKKMEAILGNLQNEILIVSSKLGPPYLEVKSNITGLELTKNSRLHGYSLDVMEALAGLLNFTYEFRLNKDKTNGAYNKRTKTWNGIMQDLVERKAHLAICDLTITEERRAVVDFTVPFMTLGISILYRKSKESEIKYFAFLDPLEMEVWLYILTFFVIVTFIMYMLTRMAPGDWENPQPLNKNPTELENVWNFKNCLWLMLGSTLCCGCTFMPKGISSRMGISMWWFLILIITNSYKANLAAFLTKQKMGGEIDSAEALAKQTKVKYGTVEGGSTSNFFRDAKNNKVYQKMWQDMIQARPSVFEKRNEDGVKRIMNTKKQGYAFLMESTQIEYEIARNCDLKQVGGRLDNKGYGIAMPFNSPYLAAINQAVLTLLEDGTLNRLKNKWWKEELGAITCPKEVTSSLSFKFAHVRGTFLVTIVGVAIAFVFSILDFLWYIRKTSVREHVTFFTVLKNEVLFALKIFITKKRRKNHKKESSAPTMNNVDSLVIL